MNVHVTKLSAEQVLLKLTCTWPTGQEEKCSKGWKGVVELEGGQKGGGTKKKQTLSRNTKINNE